MYSNNSDHFFKVKKSNPQVLSKKYPSLNNILIKEKTKAIKSFQCKKGYKNYQKSKASLVF